MTAQEIITKLEEIYNEPMNPIEFARRSADTFNTWTDENPGELQVLVHEHTVWCQEYAHRVHERLEGIPWETIWNRGALGESTTQEPPAST